MIEFIICLSFTFVFLIIAVFNIGRLFEQTKKINDELKILSENPSKIISAATSEALIYGKSPIEALDSVVDFELYKKYMQVALNEMQKILDKRFVRIDFKFPVGMHSSLGFVYPNENGQIVDCNGKVIRDLKFVHSCGNIYFENKRRQIK